MKPDTWCVVKAIDFKGWRERMTLTGALCVTVKSDTRAGRSSLREGHLIPFPSPRHEDSGPFHSKNLKVELWRKTPFGPRDFCM